MKIELTEKEVKATLEILALGYYIVGEGGCSQEKRKDYDSTISKVFGEYLQSMENVAVTERKIELSVEEYLDDVKDCLKKYTRNNLSDNIATALADYQYPVKDYITEVEQYSKNQIAEDMYLRVLTEKGISAVHIEIAPITSKKTDNHQPTHVKTEFERLEKDSIILLEQITTVDKTRLKAYVGQLDKFTMKEVSRAIRISLGIQYGGKRK